MKPLGPVDVWFNVEHARPHAKGESYLQEAFGDWLSEVYPTISWQREYRLSAHLRPDFVGTFNLGDTPVVVIYELKWYADRAALRQLTEYVCELQPQLSHPVTGTLIATSFARSFEEDTLPGWLSLVQLKLNYYRAAA